MIRNLAIIILFQLFLFVKREKLTAATAFDPNTIAGTGHEIVIRTAHLALAFSTDPEGHLLQNYFGHALHDNAEYFKASSERFPAYPTAGMAHVFENAMAVTHADGNRSLDLVYEGVRTTNLANGVVSTQIALKDPRYDIHVTLTFNACTAEDVIGESMEVVHYEKRAISVSHFASGSLFFDARAYYLTQFHGNWGEEMQIQESRLTSGIKIVDSKLGVRAAMKQSPVFMLSLDCVSAENQGEVIGGTLAWSGNFQLLFEVEEEGRLNVLAGMNPYESAYTLEPGVVFKTPQFLYTYSKDGKNGISINFHRWARKFGINDASSPRMVLLNNWEATFFDFNETKLTTLFDDARLLGVDLFLLDDGWFGNRYPRNADTAGLGDWQENNQKLPQGINYLVSEAAKRDLKFGIWIEPEMLNPKSDLYHLHPDWILRMPNRSEALERNQLILDLSNPKVQDFVFKLLDDLVTLHPRLAYLKWDCNRYMTNAWSAWLGPHRQNQLYIDYVTGLYRVMNRFHAAHPHFPMMLCSGGGGRTDYGSLPYFTEFWASDMTDPVKRFFIQWGYSYFFPSMASCNHVTAAGNTSLKFKLDVAMEGKLGFDIVPSKLSSNDLELARNAVRVYHSIALVVWYGDLYRLVSPYEGSRAILMYADSLKNRAVIFAYRFEQKNIDRYAPVRLAGLDPLARYRLNELNLAQGGRALCTENNMTLSGAYLMKAGVHIPFREDYTSSVIELVKE